MAVTIKQTEAAPAAYPATPKGLSKAAAALDAAMIWQRLETYIAYRWTARAVTWIVDGPGDWDSPLAPATIATIEIWEDDAWQSFTPSPSPAGGYVLSGCGPYRFTGTVGGGSVPAAVNEAFKRLAEYMAADQGTAGAATELADIPGVMRTEITRAPSWMARAIANSGAGDLLRNFRRA
jgi:hypothetical protein